MGCLRREQSLKVACTCSTVCVCVHVCVTVLENIITALALIKREPTVMHIIGALS